MFSANAPPPKPVNTHFVIQKSESALAIYPRPELLNLGQRLGKGLLRFKTRLLVSLTLVLVVLLLQLVSFSRFPWVLLGLLGGCSPAILIWLLTPATSIHLYLYREQNQFKICQRSLESKTRPDKILSSGLISEIQYLSPSWHTRGRFGASQGITIHASQTHSIDWSLTQAESLWIVYEIQSWLTSQKE